MTQTDCNLMLWLNFDAGATTDKLMWLASQILTWIPLYALIAILITRRYGWRYMCVLILAIAIGVGASDQICNLFKDGFKFLRPTHTESIAAQLHTVNNYVGGLYGTVSAHAATTVCIAVISSMALPSRTYRVLMGVWVAVVCYSRIYLGVHFPSQILFGIVLGAGIGYGLWRLFDRYAAPRLSKE